MRQSFTKSLTMRCLVTALGLYFCVAGVGTAEQTYDLTLDFSAAQNPNGAWSYGWTASRGSTFNLVTTQGQATASGLLIGWLPYPGIVSPAYAVTDWNAPSEFVPQGTLNLHPGPSGQNSVVRWTAPSSGAYPIQGWFRGNNFGGPTSTDVAILHGAVEIFTGAINSYNVPLNFSLGEQTNAGETIDFSVGTGGNGYGSDATGISATIFRTAAPSAAQMISDLISAVTIVEFKQGIHLLQNALSQVNRGNTGTACNQLGAFINQVQAQAGKQLTSVQAIQLILSATQIRSVLGCS